MSLSTAQKHGILFLIVMSLLNNSVNALARYTGVDIHPYQLVFLNNGMALLLLLPVFLKLRVTLPTKQNLPWLGARSVLEMLGFSLLFTSVQHVPFPAMSVLLLCTPIVGTLMAILFFNGTATRYTWMALVAGFVGVLIVARPGSDDFTAWSLMILGAVCCFSSCMNIIRTLAQTTRVIDIVFYMLLFVTLISGVFAASVWVTPSATMWQWLTVAAILTALAQSCVALSLKNADVVTVAPFLFVHIIWGSFYGAVLFDEVITLHTLLGAAVIVCGLLAATFHARTHK